MECVFIAGVDAADLNARCHGVHDLGISADPCRQLLRIFICRYPVILFGLGEKAVLGFLITDHGKQAATRQHHQHDQYRHLESKTLHVTSSKPDTHPGFYYPHPISAACCQVGRPSYANSNIWVYGEICTQSDNTFKTMNFSHFPRPRSDVLPVFLPRFFLASSLLFPRFPHILRIENKYKEGDDHEEIRDHRRT